MDDIQIARALSQELAQRIPPAQIAKVLSQAMSSTVLAKDGTVSPDTRSRLQACTMFLNYVVGKPLPRQELPEEQDEIGEEDDLLMRFMLAPSLAETFRELIRKFDVLRKDDPDSEKFREELTRYDGRDGGARYVASLRDKGRFKNGGAS